MNIKKLAVQEIKSKNLMERKHDDSLTSNHASHNKSYRIYRKNRCTERLASIISHRTHHNLTFHQERKE